MLLISPKALTSAPLLQVIFPACLNGPEGSAEEELKALIRSCLHTNVRHRIQACRLQAGLYSIMKQSKWTNTVFDCEPAAEKQKSGAVLSK